MRLPGGTYQINNADISNLTITALSSDAVIVRILGTTGDANPGLGVTIEAAPTERDYVVPAQAGNFITKTC